MLLVNLLSNCPKCSEGKIFKGTISLNRYCQVCKTSFYVDKIGDAVTWITTFLLSILVVPLAFYIDFKFDFSLLILVFLITLIILLLTIMILRISKYMLIVRLIKLETNETE